MRAAFSVYADALKIALQSIFAHKLRAFLTLIGIIIGVASVVTVGASISGLNTYVVDRVAKVLGTTEETARWRVFKACQKLMKVLAPELLPPGAMTGEPGA